MVSQRQTLAVLAIAGLVVVSGCITMNVNTEVNNDGTIDQYRIKMKMPSMVLDQMNSTSEEPIEQNISEGYDESLYDSINVDVGKEAGDQGQQGFILIELNGFDPAEVQGNGFGGQGTPEPGEASGPTVTVNASGDTITFKDRSFMEETSDGGDGGQMDANYTLNYRLEMPGEITDSNADEVDGNVAIWNRTGENALSNTMIRATSEKGSESGDGGGGVLGLPGFGASVALVAVLAALAVLAMRRRD